MPGNEPLTPSPSFEVQLPETVDISASLETFRRSGDDGIDRWDGTNLVRTLPAEGHHVAYLCTLVRTGEYPVLRVHTEDTGSVPAIRQAVLNTFLAAPPEFAALLQIDPVIARLNARFPGLRPVRQFDLLTALIRSISAQQVNLRWAATTRRRLAEAFGRSHLVAGFPVYSLNAADLAGTTVAAIRALQFTTRKAEYIVAAADAVASGRLDLSHLATLPDEEVVAQLTALRGIGRWTAEWLLARTLGRPCVVAGDLGVRKAVSLAYLDAPLASEMEVRQATAHWGKAAGVAQGLLLHGYAVGVL